jgi:hypothetical protein
MKLNIFKCKVLTSDLINTVNIVRQCIESDGSDRTWHRSVGAVLNLSITYNQELTDPPKLYKTKKK